LIEMLANFRLERKEDLPRPLAAGAFHFFGCFFALRKDAVIETIENWSLKIGHLLCKQ